MQPLYLLPSFFSTTSLFFRYHKLNTRLNALRPIILERTLFYEKLLEMSGTIDPSSIKTTSPVYGQFLSFDFNNGFKDNANLSGKCTCSMYHDENQNLCYVVENEKKEACKRTLLQNISSFKASHNSKTLTITISFLQGKDLKYTFLLPTVGVKS